MRRYKLTTYVFVWITLLSMSGCVPALITFWSPSAEGARTLNTHCGTAIAPSGTLAYSLGKATLHIEGYQTGVQLKLIVPSGSSVVLQSLDAEINDSGTRQVIHSGISAAKYYDFEARSYKQANPLEPMVGSTRRHALGTEVREYILSIDQLQIVGEEYHLRLPRITVDGAILTPPVILFHKSRGFGVFPINC